jgi:hypothetical protein
MDRFDESDVGSDQRVVSGAEGPDGPDVPAALAAPAADRRRDLAAADRDLAAELVGGVRRSEEPVYRGRVVIVAWLT